MEKLTDRDTQRGPEKLEGFRKEVERFKNYMELLELGGEIALHMRHFIDKYYKGEEVPPIFAGALFPSLQLKAVLDAQPDNRDDAESAYEKLEKFQKRGTSFEAKSPCISTKSTSKMGSFALEP